MLMFRNLEEIQYIHNYLTIYMQIITIILIVRTICYIYSN